MTHDSRPWYEEYFGADYIKTHRSNLDRTTKEEVSFIIQTLGVQPGDKILDVPCGYGRHALEMARKGFQVTGVDLSEKFVEMACHKAEHEGLLTETSFVQRDMRRLQFESEYDAVINVFNSFGYFGEDEDLDVLDGISRALRSNGRFLLEQGNRDYYVRNAPPTSWEEHGDCYVLYKFAFHAESGTAHTQQTIIDKDGSETRTYDVPMRIYTFSELRSMLEFVGLMPYAVYGDWDGSGFSVDSRRMIVAAMKTD